MSIADGTIYGYYIHLGMITIFSVDGGIIKEHNSIDLSKPINPEALGIIQIKYDEYEDVKLLYSYDEDDNKLIMLRQITISYKSGRRNVESIEINKHIKFFSIREYEELLIMKN